MVVMIEAPQEVAIHESRPKHRLATRETEAEDNCDGEQPHGSYSLFGSLAGNSLPQTSLRRFHHFAAVMADTR